MLYDRSSRIVTIGIYLTESCAADGGLMVIPGSQHDRRDVAAIVREREAEAIGISAAPGDMVVHDTMLVHSSTALRERPRRITLYFEFREAAHVVSNERFSSSCRNARRDLQRLERICSEGPRFGIAHLIEQCYAQSAAIEPAQY
jgi:ectoine hydroxylase-related dioxygenase (phytanoyl-CoA dioxygenase family)